MIKHFHISSPTLARLALLGCGFSWGLETVLFKRVVTTMPFEMALLLRNVLVALLAVAVLLVKDQGLHALVLSRSQVRAVLLSTLFAAILGDLLFYSALRYAPVVNGLVLGHLQPFFIALFATHISRRDAPTRRQLLGGSVMFIAAILVTSRDPHELWNFTLGSPSDVILVIAALSWSIATLIFKHSLNTLSPSAFLFYRYAPATLLLAAVLPSWFLRWNTLLLPNALVLACGMGLYFMGLRVLSAAEVAFLELFAVFFGALFGWFYLGETTTAQQLFGIGLLFFGVYLLSFARPTPPICSSPNTQTDQ